MFPTFRSPHKELPQIFHSTLSDTSTEFSCNRPEKKKTIKRLRSQFEKRRSYYWFESVRIYENHHYHLPYVCYLEGNSKRCRSNVT